MAIDGKRLVSIFLVLFSALGSFSCGGSSGSGGGATAPEGTAIAVNFLGSLPVAVAEQIGTGAWASATLQGTGLNLTVPSGTTSYSLAFLCPDTGPVDNEVVIEATTQDATTYSPDPLFCPPNPVMTTSSGSVDASAIPGAVNVGIYGNRGFGTGSLGATVAAFDPFFLTGANDIAAVAYDASNDVIAVKIVRNQTVPFNGLSIVFAPSDVTSVYPAAINGAPSGFTVASAVLAQYVTANGTSFVVSHQVPSTQYSAVASTETAAGDYYEFSGNATDLSTNQ